jgi:hypothetical protein
MTKLKKRTGTMAILSLLLMSMTFVSVRAFDITGTIYIRADGSIDPSTAPIQRNGDTYTLTDNIFQSDIYATTIVIERDNIVFDGAGYTLRARAR